MRGAQELHQGRSAGDQPRALARAVPAGGAQGSRHAGMPRLSCCGRPTRSPAIQSACPQLGPRDRPPDTPSISSSSWLSTRAAAASALPPAPRRQAIESISSKKIRQGAACLRASAGGVQAGQGGWPARTKCGVHTCTGDRPQTAKAHGGSTRSTGRQRQRTRLGKAPARAPPRALPAPPGGPPRTRAHLAVSNTSRTARSDSPSHFCSSSGPRIDRKLTPHCAAAALASRVFPQPAPGGGRGVAAAGGVGGTHPGARSMSRRGGAP